MTGLSDMAATRAPLQVVNRAVRPLDLIPASDVLSGKWARAALLALLTLLLIGLLAGAPPVCDRRPGDLRRRPTFRLGLKVLDVGVFGSRHKANRTERNAGEADPGFRRLI